MSLIFGSEQILLKYKLRIPMMNCEGVIYTQRGDKLSGKSFFKINGAGNKNPLPALHQI